MIIGLTGKMCSGKGEAAEILERLGFEHYTYSDIIKQEAKKQGIDPTRENLQKLGTKLKQERGHGYLSKILLQKIKTDKAVVDGIRNPDEVLELRKRHDFKLIAITTDQKSRFERIKSRKRQGDPQTFEEFKALDDLENQGKTLGQKINQTIAMADYTIENKSTKQELKENIKNLISSLSK